MTPKIPTRARKQSKFISILSSIKQASPFRHSTARPPECWILLEISPNYQSFLGLCGSGNRKMNRLIPMSTKWCSLMQMILEEHLSSLSLMIIKTLRIDFDFSALFSRLKRCHNGSLKVINAGVGAGFIDAGAGAGFIFGMGWAWQLRRCLLEDNNLGSFCLQIN